MKRIPCCFLLLCFVAIASGQSNANKFAVLSDLNDTVRMKSLLLKWNSTHPEDPELYVAGMNFYVKSKARHAIDSALAYANRGIKRFPERLDMRFGKIYLLGEAARYNEFSSEINETLDHGHSIKNDWLWAADKKVEQPDSAILESVQTYLMQLYATEDDKLLENMKRIGVKTLSYYPDAIKILSTTAVANLVTKNYDTAMAYLLHAERLAPTDYVVLGNLAKAYDLQGNTALAIRYYELVKVYGDTGAVSDAEQHLGELKSK